LPFACGVQQVLLAGAAEADVELVVEAEVVRIVVYDGVHVGACVGFAAGTFFRPFGGGGGAACRVGRLARCRSHGVGRAVGIGVGISAWVGVYVLVAYMVVGRVAYRSIVEVKRSGSRQANTSVPQQSSALPPHSERPFPFPLYGWHTCAT